jgi:D-threonate/D-erythronate kinase
MMSRKGDGRVVQRVVIADDLTGASDAGLQFAKRGLRTTVWLDFYPGLREIDADVLVCDSDGRAATWHRALWRMQGLLGRIHPLTPSRIIKKMDSTLRGSLGPELRALLDAMPNAIAIVCPAFPKQGRVCRDGILYVHGVRVDESDFARDPLSPVRDARVAAQLEAPAALLTLTELRAGTAHAHDEIERARTLGIRIIVADAETDDDLRTLATLARLRDDVLWTGSAGLLEYLADDVAQCHPDPSTSSGEGCATIVPPATGPVVFIVGSRSDMTQRQIEAFAAHPGHDTELIGAIDLMENSFAVTRKAVGAAEALQRGMDTLIAVDGGSYGVSRALETGRAYNWGSRRTSQRIRDRLVAMVDESVRSDSGATVVLSGGDVARAFCEHRGIRGLELIAEVAPGIPISRAIGANLRVVTKAGGFGHANTYLDIAAALHAKAIT